MTGRKFGAMFCTILLASTMTFGFSANMSYGEAYIKVSPSKGPPGSVVTVSGWGFADNTLTNIHFNDEFVGATTTGVDGTFTRVITIPSTASIGTYKIQTSNNVNTVDYQFTVTEPASISISPDRGIAGTAVTVEGSKFGASQSIAIMLDGIRIDTNPPNLLSSSSGTFSATIHIPSVESGKHIVTATNGIFGASAILDVRESATIQLSSSSGSAGSAVKIIGSQFSANSAITVKFDATKLATSDVKTTNDGTFSLTITIPTGIAVGTSVITATDSSGRIGSALFNVSESSLVTLSPTTGYSGASIAISGSAFNPGSIVTVKMGSTNLSTKPSTIRASESGAFTATITLPNTADIGPHTITFTDSAGKVSSAVININGPSPLSLSREIGIAGSIVTVSAAGFNPDSVVTIKFGSNTLPLTKTDSKGNFQTTVSIPNVSVGTYNISATDEFGRSSSAMFMVRIPANLSINPSTGPPGTEVTVTGTKFVNNANVTIMFSDSEVGTFPPNVISSALGKFLTKFRIPDVEDGDYTIYAEDSSGVTSTALFRVKHQGLSLDVSQIHNRGGLVEIAGTGFPPWSPVTIKFNDEIIVTNPPRVNTTAIGTFTASFSVPGMLANGNYEITAISNDVITNTTLELKRQYIDDRYGILISVVPEKYDFELGETLAISGRVLALNNNNPLILKIINPNNAACTFQQLSLKEDMTFAAMPVKLEGQLCSQEGEYKITAFYGSGRALTKFRVADSTADELTGGKAEVINAQKVTDILMYDNKYTIDLDWATNAVLLRNNVNETVTFYLMFAEFDADEITKNLSYKEVTLAPYDKSYVVAPYVPQVKNGKPDGYLHVFAWTSLNEPKPLHPGLYVPY
jgi:hypothetical protein